MMNLRKFRWLAAPVVAVGLLGSAHSSYAAKKEAEVVAEGSERVVRYDDLPKDVKRAVDEARKNHEVKQIMLVNPKGEREFYRAIIDTKGDDLIVRINAAGKIISEQEARDVNFKPARATPEAVRANGLPAGAHEVAYDDLPGRVKEGIGREALNRKIERVYLYDHKGQPIYMALTGNPNGRQEEIRVRADGTLFSEADATEVGKNTVRESDLPYAPKTALGRVAGAGHVTKIEQTTRDGKTFYQCWIDDGGNKTRYVQITDSGEVVKEQTEGNTDTATPDRRRK